MSQENDNVEWPQDMQAAPPPPANPPAGPPGGMPPVGGPPPGGMPPAGPPPGYGPPPGPPPEHAGPPPGQPYPGQPHPGYEPVPPGQPYGAPPPGYGMPPVAQMPPDGGEPKAKGARPWVIATIVAALLAVLGFGWGFMQKQSASTASQDSDAQIAQLQAALEKSQQEDAALQQEIDELQSEYAKVEEKFKTAKKNLGKEAGKLNNLEKQYKQAQADAQKAKATLKDELQAADAKAALAQKCAQVMATGLQLIYTADNYNQAMKDVVKEMQRASDSCGGVVNIE